MAMNHPGTIAPPDGVEPDLENPQDVLNTVMYVTQALTLFFVSIFIALRVYSKRWIMGKAFTWDDWSTYITYVLMVGYCITSIFAAVYGAGYDQWEVSNKDVRNFLKCIYASTIFYAPMAMTVKFALLLIIIRVFGTVHYRTIVGMKLFLAIIGLYYFSGLIVKIFTCHPISAYWQGPRSKCIDQRAVFTVDAVISVVTDLVILLLPTPLIWSLQMSRKKRMRITGMLCAGGVATGFSVYRLVLVVLRDKSPNETIVLTKVVLSGNAEVGIGLICACLPAVNTVLGKVKSSSYAASRSSAREEQPPPLPRILLTRSFHVDRSSIGSKENLGDGLEGRIFGHSRARSVADVQANPPRTERHHTQRRTSDSTSRSSRSLVGNGTVNNIRASPEFRPV